MTEKEIKTDVLVVGGGGAGFRAAIGAKEKGAKTTLLSKGPLGRCGATPMAGADFTLDGKSLKELGLKGDANDSKEKVFNDIVTQGFYLNNQSLVKQYVKSAPNRLKELMDWGIFIRMSDERSILTGGIGIMDALLKQARSLGVDMLEDTMLIDLIVQDGKISGALGLDIRTGDFIRFKASAVIIATGGWHKAFHPNTGMRDLSGEGIAIAHRAGADIGNMEFITFCCNIFYDPPLWRGSIAPYIISIVLGGTLSNNLGEDILNRYDSELVETGTKTEWNKSFLSFATAREVREGKGFKNGGLHYTRGDIPWKKFESIASRILHNWKYKAMDLSDWRDKLEKNEPVELGPAVEYFDGGIVVNDRFETDVEGLYAAGECTLGPFGANRVFSAITEMLVHGADAGENAADYVKGCMVPEPGNKEFEPLQEKAESPLKRRDGIRPSQVRRPIQQMAHTHLGPIRNHEELTDFLRILGKARKDKIPNLGTASDKRVYNKEWVDALELENTIYLLEAAVKSALARTESRGVHYRADYPDTDNDNWVKESIVKLEGSDLEIYHRPVVTEILTPPSGVTPYLEMMKKMMDAHSDTGGHH